MGRRRLIAEWEPQDGTLLAWPHESTDWGPSLHNVEPAYIELVHQVTRRQQALVCCYDHAHRAAVAGLLSEAGIDPQRVQLCEVRFDDTWTRDYGPLSVATGEGLELCDLRFNGWGSKFPADQDNLVTRELHRQGRFGAVPLRSGDWVLEGGGIESDGDNTVLATRQSVLRHDRNPGWTAARLEQHFHEWFGVRRVLWLDVEPLPGDDTDGHIDTLARFCDPQTIAFTACRDPADPRYPQLDRLAAQLASFRTPGGPPYRLVPLPVPSALGREALPANYANFTVINGAVLTPLYNDPADQIALRALEDCFPDREVVGIDCVPLINQAGAVHCATMHLPRGVLDGAGSQRSIAKNND